MTTANIEQLLLSKTWFKRIIELNKIEDNYYVPKITDLVNFITEDNINVENADRCEMYFSSFILGWYLKTHGILDLFFDDDVRYQVDQEQQAKILANIHVVIGDFEGNEHEEGLYYY